MPGKTEGRGDFCTCNHPRAVHGPGRGVWQGPCFLCDCRSFVERTAQSHAGVNRPVKSKKKESAQ